MCKARCALEFVFQEARFSRPENMGLEVFDIRSSDFTIADELQIMNDRGILRLVEIRPVSTTSDEVH